MSWDWDYAWEIFPFLLEGLKVTIEVTILGSLVAFVLGLIVAALRRTRSKLVTRPVVGAVEVVRSTPLLVLLYVLYYVLPDLGLTLSAMVVGVAGLGIYYSSYTSEVYRAGIENVPKGQWEAATALGLPRRRIWFGIVLPQAVRASLPALGNQSVAMFKDSAVLSTITVVELLATAENQASLTYKFLEPFVMVGCMYFVISYAASLLIQVIERRMKYM